MRGGPWPPRPYDDGQPPLYKQITQDGFGGDRLYTIHLHCSLTASTSFKQTWDLTGAPKPHDGGRSHKALWSLVHMGVSSGAANAISLPGGANLNFYVSTDLPTPQSYNCSTALGNNGGAPTASDNVTRQERPCFQRISMHPSNQVAMQSGGGAMTSPFCYDFKNPTNTASLVSVYPVPKISMFLLSNGGFEVANNATVTDWTLTFQIQLLD